MSIKEAVRSSWPAAMLLLVVVLLGAAEIARAQQQLYEGELVGLGHVPAVSSRNALSCVS